MLLSLQWDINDHDDLGSISELCPHDTQWLILTLLVQLVLIAQVIEAHGIILVCKIKYVHK